MRTDHLPKCPACQEDMSYPDGTNYVCAQCDHEVDCKTEAGNNVAQSLLFENSLVLSRI
ncbi:MAG TPA: hypothetical protein DCW35_09485 [Polynucleobacter sp.]|nr:hypothetical protein [Polynucleobacter sp.]